MASSSPECPIKGGNQSTFKCDELSILIWRRILLTRYFQKLGEYENTDIKWKDFDKSGLITVNDEKKNFVWKLPHKSLTKSSIDITTDRKKLCVFTLFYSTHSILIQGKYTETWFEEEYKNLAGLVDKIKQLKGDNTRFNIDNEIHELAMTTGLFNVDINDGKENDSNIDNDNSSDKSTGDSTKPVEIEDTELRKQKTHKTDIDSENKDTENAGNNSDSNKLSEVSQVLHKIELKLIENARKSDQILTLCVNMKESFEAQVTQIKNEVKTLGKTMSELETNIKTGAFYKTDKFRSEWEKLEKLETNTKDIQTKFKTTCDSLIKSVDQVKIKDVFETVKETKTQTAKDALKLDKILNVIEKIAEKPRAEEKKVISDNMQESNIKVNQQSDKRSMQKHDNVNRAYKGPKADLWIVGSSIVKDLDGRKLYMSKNTRINTLGDKTVLGATKFIESGKVVSDNIMFQIGSNDLEYEEPDRVLQEIEQLVETTESMHPNSKIILAEIVPRFLRDIDRSVEYEQKRQQYNLLLKDYCSDKSIPFVTYKHFRASDFTDGIHLNGTGIRILVRDIKTTTNPILGITYEVQNQSRRDNSNRNRDGNRQGNNYLKPHFYNSQSFSKPNNYSSGPHPNYNMYNQSAFTKSSTIPDNSWGNRKSANLLPMLEMMLVEMRNNVKY